MATYGDMKARIADELSRTDLSAQIASEIQSAIFYYQDDRFYFDQRRDVTFNTVTGQEFYTSTDITNFNLLIDLDAVTVTVNGNRFNVKPWPYPDLEMISVTTTTQGEPNYYAIYAQQMRLYPIPQQVYSIRLSGVFSLAAPVLDADSNAWTNDAEELIRARAKKKVNLNYIKDTEQATIDQTSETEAYNGLINRTAKYLSTGQLVGSL